MALSKGVCSLLGLFWSMVIAQGINERLMAADRAVEVRLQSYDRGDYRGELIVRLTDSTVAKFVYRGQEKQIELEPLRLTAESAEVVFSGNLAWEHYRAGKQKSQGECRRRVIDFTGLMEPFRDDKLTWQERLVRFRKAQEVFELKFPELVEEYSPQLEDGVKADDAQILAAEERLGFSLPKSHRALLLEAGGLQIDDSHFMKVNDLASSYEQMRRNWETPEPELDSLPQQLKAFLRRSTILYTEIGDGYSALICEPIGRDAQPDSYRYHWLTQDQIVSPTLLQDEDGRLFDHPMAMSWLFANQVVRKYEEVGTDDVFADFGTPKPLVYSIKPLFPAPKVLEARMLLDWSRFR